MFLEQSIIFIQIIFIDIVMAADNAIIIGMIAANFAAATPKAIIFFLLSGAKLAAIIPIMIALSAAITISMNMICSSMIDCSRNIYDYLYYLIVKN